MTRRRYVVGVEKIERVVVEVEASNAREARKKAHDERNWMENWGWDGMHSTFGKVLDVRRDGALQRTPRTEDDA